MPTETRTTIAILVMTVLGVMTGVYLGTRYRPRHAAPPPAVTAPQVPAAQTGTGTAPALEPGQPAVGAGGQAPAAGHPGAAPGTPVKSSENRPSSISPASSPAGRARSEKPGPRTAGSESRPPVRSPRSRLPIPSGESQVARAPAAGTKTTRSSRLSAAPQRRAAPRRLRVVGTMPPVRQLPVPRQVRQRRVARALAQQRRSTRTLAQPRQSLSLRLEPPPRPPVVPRLTRRIEPTRSPSLTARPLTASVRRRALARAVQTVRYLERDVVLEGRPATLATYIIWEQTRPRTFSFVRHDRRTDQARIVRVDEAARRVTALVPARGSVVQAEVPLEAVVAYSQALSFDPPSSMLVARADELLRIGGTPGMPPDRQVAGTPRPVERVGGSRELLGRVTRVDAANRLITVEGGEEKTPFRVPEGIVLPNVGELVSLTTAPDAQVSPPVAMSVTALQPTVQGVLTHVRPIAVELWVRTVTPEGVESEVPVPISPDARIYQGGKLVPLRTLKEGTFIRAFITPAGEVRIVSHREVPGE